MKRAWLKSNSICLAMGDSVALNLMFENQQDHELFFEFWKKYLGNMASLLHYHLAPTGWVLLFKTKSSQEIKAAYHEQRSKSKKAKEKSTLKDDSRMLSEHFRIFLSQFVRRSNAKHQRKGAKVMQRFHRYVLKESADYKGLFDMLTRKLRLNPQTKKKYQADETKYDIRNEMNEESILKVGTRMYLGYEKGFKVRYGVVLLNPVDSVLRKYLPLSKPINFHNKFT